MLTLVNTVAISILHGEGPPSFKRQNAVSIGFIYMKISGNVADRIPSLQI